MRVRWRVAIGLQKREAWKFRYERYSRSGAKGPKLQISFNLDRDLARNPLPHYLLYLRLHYYDNLMPDPLFAKNKSSKRKRSQPSVTRPNTKNGFRKQVPASASKKRRPNDEDDEELSSEKDETLGVFDDVDLEGPGAQLEDASGDEFEDETPAEKRLRLAKLYLNSVKKGITRGGDDDEGEEVAGWDAEELDREIIESRLQRDVVSLSDALRCCAFELTRDIVSLNILDASIPSSLIR